MICCSFTPANPAKAVSRAPSAVTTVAAASIPALRIVANDSGVKTMSSLDLVDYINFVRKPGEAILRHDHFMAKVPTVLGQIQAPKFLGTQKYGNNITRNVYNFPRKEAIRMAMSYSYELQEAVLDAWDAAELKVAAAPASVPVALIPNFDDPIAAAEAWIAEKKQTNVLKLELSTATVALEAAAPKRSYRSLKDSRQMKPSSSKPPSATTTSIMSGGYTCSKRRLFDSETQKTPVPAPSGNA